ncbi:MAG: glycosyltransferase family 4 protein [Methylovulum sp.]|uniref:glycosyltransferase family 4 protein n=1 Tax=Methylovulum sp. TaxID=1916980 RepID=UPI0026129E5C|nr:glycosyltransferase family 4 protein [Methylovulum sp.]MDD2725354.1 glycosyltransferase family 4 protein [Methylovulum sp.]MDD5124449.1 glycosyltransferase family 4 protein [Methylovulum sp.]
MSKKWLFILPWEPNFAGGVNHVVFNLINKLETNEAIKPELLIAQKSGLFGLAKTPVHYSLLANPSWNPGILGLAIYLIKSPLLLYKLHRLIASNTECVNLHYVTLDAINFVFLKKLGLFKGKIILSFHGSDLLPLKKSAGIEKWLWHYVFRNVDFMVSCSRRLSEELSEYINNPRLANKIKTIHNGVDIGQLETALVDARKSPPDISKDSKIILNVGTFQFIKGQDVLIKAFAKLKLHHKHLKLILIGFVNDHLEHCERLTSELNCKNDVVFIKNLAHESVLDYFQEADIFCLPSRREAFGIVLLEAGYYSCPVVASNVGGIPEIIDHGENGYLVPPDNVDELANAIGYLLEDSHLAKQMGKRLNEKVRKNFTWDNACSAYLELLSG